MEIKGTIWVLVALSLKPSVIESTPIVADVLKFEDQWNYTVKPHSIPLLGDMTKNHILPPVPKTVATENSKKTNKVNRAGKKLGDAVKSRVSCPVCRLGVGLLEKEVKKNASFEDIKTKFVGLCVAFKVESEPICTGIFDVYGPVVLPVVKSAQIGAEEACSLVLGETCGDVENPLHEWKIELPGTVKPEITEPEIPKEGLPTFKVLHLSDTHLDPQYSEGSPSNCEEPLCCRSYSTPPEKTETIPAGKWGSYHKCDSPRILMENMLKHIAEDHPDIDYILWTGDLVPHDVWNQTKEGNLHIIQETVNLIFEAFPRTPVFPSLGNHESVPAGNFAPPWLRNPDHSIAWLYTKIADHWRKWLPASSGNTVLHGGFYSILIRPGFRIISLNTNYCHSLSWWLLVNSTDPAKELQWLIYELQEAENKGEKVHIIGHIAPGSTDCMKVWSRNYYDIVERYESTIVAQFYGHSHADEFELFYDVKDNSRATNVAYLGPSVTTYEHFNPAYRIYYVDGDRDNTTREVIDHETWTFNLDEANRSDKEPMWYRLYSAKEAFNLEALRPKNWASLVEEMIDNSHLFEQFYKYYYRDSPTRPPCDDKCKLQILCDLRSGRSNFRHHLCQDLELIFG